MRLTLHADYALRVLMYLGLRDDRLCTIAEIATAYGISESHLTKVAHRLGLRGLVRTVRGHGGGLQLALPPERIGLRRVVRSMEDDLRIVECFDPQTCTCPIADRCALTGILDEALAAFLAVLDRHSLADLLGPRGALLRRLGIERPRATPARPSSRHSASRRTPAA